MSISRHRSLGLVARAAGRALGRRRLRPRPRRSRGIPLPLHGRVQPPPRPCRIRSWRRRGRCSSPHVDLDDHLAGVAGAAGAEPVESNTRAPLSDPSAEARCQELIRAGRTPRLWPCGSSRLRRRLSSSRPRRTVVHWVKELCGVTGPVKAGAVTRPIAGGLMLLAAASGLLSGRSAWMLQSLSHRCEDVSPPEVFRPISGFDLFHTEDLGARFPLAAWLLVAGIVLLFLLGIAVVARRSSGSLELGASVIGSLLIAAAALLATPSASRGLCGLYGPGRGEVIGACAAAIGLAGSVLLARSMRRNEGAMRRGASEVPRRKERVAH